MMMLKNFSSFSSWYIFLILLVFSIILSISSNSLLWMWLSMEFNTMFFIPLMKNFNSLNSSEQILKYFLIQSISSNLILYFSFLWNIFIGLNLIKQNPFIFLFLLLKMGSAPFLFWLINMIDNFSWTILFLLTTIQKVIPFNFIIILMNIKLIFIMIVLNSLSGSLMGLNQFSLRKIMIFSSINHLSWTLMSLMISTKMFKFYFLFYSVMMYFQCFMFSSIKINYLHQMFMNFKNNLSMDMKTKYNSIMFILIYFMSLPPLMGVFPKFLIMLKMETTLFNLILIMIFMNLISLTFYTRMIISFFMNSFVFYKINTMYKKYNYKNFLFLLFTIMNFMMFLFFFQKIL